MSKSLQSMVSDVIDLSNLTALAAVTAATALVGWMVTKPKCENGENAKRRFSLMSENLAQGSFPPEVKFDEAIINVVMIFDDNDRPSVDELVESCVKLLLQYDRFSSVFDRKSSSASNCGDTLDPYDLVRTIPVSDCSTDEDLLKAMEDQACVPLAQAPRGTMLPWWELVLLENTNKAKGKGGKSAVVWRIHHSLGDGISLVKVVQEMFQNAKTGKPLSYETGAGDLSKKFKIRRSALDWISQTLMALVNVIPLPIGKFDDLTAFRAGQSIDPKTMVFPSKQEIIPFVPMPLDFVKRLKTSASSASDDKEKKVTINDVLFTVTSQAIYDYLKEEHDPVLQSKGKKLGCRTLLPIALPRSNAKDKSKAMRNFWCFVSCDLMVGLDDVLERLWSIHQNLTDLKKGLIPLVSNLLSMAVMKLPSAIGRDQTLQLFARHSMVLSNVPGPAEPVSFANHEIISVHMIHMNLIPQLSFLSYRGTIFANAIVSVEDDADNKMTRRRRERLPLHVSNALVMLASKLQVTDVPESISNHASQL